MNFEGRVVKGLIRVLRLAAVGTVLLLIINEPIYQATYREQTPQGQPPCIQPNRQRTNLPDNGNGHKNLMFSTPEGWRLWPNSQTVIKNHVLSKQDISIRTNEFGLRGPQIGQRQPNEYRLLIIGDSITLGDYVKEADTYPAQLEQRLERLQIGARRVRVINAGIGSLDLKAEVRLLAELADRIRPDRVIIGLYLNDASPSCVLEQPYGPFSMGAVSQGLYYRFAFAVLEVKLLMRQARYCLWIRSFTKGVPSNIRKGDWKTDPEAFKALIVGSMGDWGYAWHPDAWKSMHSSFEQLKQLQDRYGFRLMIVLFPVKYQVEADYLEDWPQRKFDQMMSEFKFSHKNLLPSLKQAGRGAKEPFYYDHCHLTPAGYRVVAECIANELIKENF